MLLGVTNAEGRYEIATSAGEKGAPAGLYKVYLAQVQEAATFDYAKPSAGGPKKNTDLIPANYQSPGTTELSVEVSATGATYDCCSIVSCSRLFIFLFMQGVSLC